MDRNSRKITTANNISYKVACCSCLHTHIAHSQQIQIHTFLRTKSLFPFSNPIHLFLAAAFMPTSKASPNFA